MSYLTDRATGIDGVRLEYGQGEWVKQGGQPPFSTFYVRIWKDGEYKDFQFPILAPNWAELEWGKA